MISSDDMRHREYARDRARRQWSGARDREAGRVETALLAVPWRHPVEPGAQEMSRVKSFPHRAATLGEPRLVGVILNARFQ